MGALMFAVAPAAARAQSCDTILPEPGADSPVQRPFSSMALVRLRDIGVYDLAFPDARSIGVSPDGKRIAFQIRQADPDTNSYCLALIGLDLRAGSRPVVLDHGGTLIRGSYDLRGKADFPTGMPKPINPIWSRDGTWVAFLKQDGGVPQVWRADADGRGSRPITHIPVGVDDFAFTEDGGAIILLFRPALASVRAQLEREALRGYHFDDRFSPMSRAAPFPAAPIEDAAQVMDLATGDLRAATDAETMLVRNRSGAPATAHSYARNAAGDRAWTELDTRPGPYGRLHLLADGPAGRPTMCVGCGERIIRLWWSGDGKRVQYLQREGWALSATGLYEWTPGAGSPRRLFVSDDVLADCAPADPGLICLREGASSPRHVVIFSDRRRAFETIFEPNPEVAGLAKGAIERLYWKNAEGIEVFGDLVLPVGYAPGTRYPLIIVQYESRGFLRGGTGDEYPIQLFANHGYAILSMNRPRLIGVLRGGRDGAEIDRLNLEGFADRKSVVSALDAGIQKLIDRGLVDPERIGITGLSDGATTLQYELVHSRRFAAAAMSSPPWDPTFHVALGPAAARDFVAMGYPALTDNAPAFWQQFSLARNARSISTPLLLQVADDEYLSGLEGYTALREAGAPVDLYVFPGEHHIKWQPAHRLALYDRSLAWFDFWLKGERPGWADPAELQRWDAFRARHSDILDSR
ncbi:MAG: Atxe2 family lasso peptide isopeptidase [Sphingobium sp.]|nr:Atxe2 family lasso peptide isopeptidase [Sphingobium sp.]